MKVPRKFRSRLYFCRNNIRPCAIDIDASPAGSNKSDVADAVPTKTLLGATSRRPAFGSWQLGHPAATSAAKRLTLGQGCRKRRDHVAATCTSDARCHPGAQGAARAVIATPCSACYIGPACCVWTGPVLVPSCQLPADTCAGQARACYHDLGRRHD